MAEEKERESNNGNEPQRLTRLEAWLSETGRRRTWFAKRIGYTYANLWSTIAGLQGPSERFVTACFNRFPELPADTFEEQGYVRRGGDVWKRIPLQEA